MDLNLWKGISSFVAIDKYPTLPCPYCAETGLKLEQSSIQARVVTEGKLLEASKRYQRDKDESEKKRKERHSNIEESAPFLVRLIWAAFDYYSEATSPINGVPHLFNSFYHYEKCNGHVSASGVLLKPKKGLEDKPKPDFVKVEHFSPTVPIFHLSENTPHEVGKELFDAFKHSHFDTPSSASKLRRAIERFCDDMKLDGKVLHSRIDQLKETYPEEAKQLLALKLIGNEGTHGSGVEELDLLYAFQIFQVVLELYDRKARLDSIQSCYEKLADKYDKKKQKQLVHKTPAV
ncbi:DUF4145 domain-containing protein [Pseudoalteromonas luteoviolacea]|uniref:DUF4145 domain-containing protein n=1 Tax=Pseudoalteromonas luteoviolacea S4060-1 TaxID=1365257 RepID=A0A162BS60_9GAMM|nr:DUF4145 domain-containing protein [Pseudoalteromonas luteoviolacea]KZN67513.1 hypothetical protein N478_01815 [Pseudoalteromonas luteoviolacea S4060-1]